MAQVPTKSSYLQIDTAVWKKNKEIKHTKSGRIDKVIDSLTVILKDGTIIRLASIDVPRGQGDRQSADGIHLARVAEKALSVTRQILREGTEVVIYQTRQAKSGRINRMNHQLAHIVTKKDNIWLQGTLLRYGLARIYTAPKQNALLKEMIQIENKSIKNKTIIWSDESNHKILDGNDKESLKSKLGEFTVIEGTVQKVASVRNNIYLNFGNDWKTDFTVMLSPSDRKTLAKRYIDPLQLANERVQVRGWLREYNGPLIELEDTAHLQILGKNSTLPAVTK